MQQAKHEDYMHTSKFLSLLHYIWLTSLNRLHTHTFPLLQSSCETQSTDSAKTNLQLMYIHPLYITITTTNKTQLAKILIAQRCFRRAYSAYEDAEGQIQRMANFLVREHT
jgi:hypothetical protein